MSILPYPKQNSETIPQESTVLVSDAQLLSQFLKLKNEDAFTAMVNRYGNMVFAVAVRIVRDRHVAEDVTQAVFLVLAKDAKKIKRREALSSWLHGVTLRLAKKSMKRRSREQVYNVVTEQEVAEKSFEEIHSIFEQQVLDEELQKLPAQYRDPLVLHFLQGKTYEETAQLLGVTLGAIEGRMKRGKRELKLRLTKRGVSLGGVLAALSWSQAEAAVSLQPEIIHTIAENGLAAFRGTAFTPACSSEAVYLAGKELTMLTTTKIAITTLALAVATGTGWVTHSGFAQDGGRSAADSGPQFQTKVDDAKATNHQSDESLTLSQSGDKFAENNDVDLLITGGEKFDAGVQQLRHANLNAQIRSLGQHVDALAKIANDPFTGGDIKKMTAQIRSLQTELTQLADSYPEQVAPNQTSDLVSQPIQTEHDMGVLATAMGMGYAPTPSSPTISVEKNQSPAAEKIEQALEEPNKSLEMIDQPLRDAIEYISAAYQIPTIIDEQELEKEGMSVEEPLNFAMDENTISTRDALELMLEKLDLTYIIKNGVMVVTTQIGAESNTETRVYDVRPLKIEDPEALSDVLLNTVDPDSWGQTGGTGEVSFLNGSLVVIQSQSVHEKIEVLLNQLAKQVEANPESPSWPAKRRNVQGAGFSSGMMGGG